MDNMRSLAMTAIARLIEIQGKALA